MRTIVVICFMLFILVYSHVSMYLSLCGLVAFTALKEYPGLPNPLDAKGVNHWSVMVAGILLAWVISRIAHHRPFNIPRLWLLVIGLYLLAESIAIARLCLDLEAFKDRASLVNPSFADYNVRAVLVDRVYGPMRFMLLGFLLCDGARSRRQLLIGLGAVLAAVLIYALIVDKQIPLSSLSGGGASLRHRIERWTGRHPNDLARMFAATFWVGVTYWQLKLGSPKLRLIVLAAAAIVLMGLAHTHSRGGYLGFVVAGLVVSLVAGSWRTLIILTAAVVAVIFFAPSVSQRIMMGVDTSGAGHHDMGEVTAGRDVIWPAALEGIQDSPVVGYGSYGYVISPALDESLANGGGELHPHNAYLETLLDHGIAGAPARLGPFLYIFGAGVFLAWRRSDPVLRLVGLTGVAWASVTFTMGLTGQHFGLTENLFTFWCVAGLVVRAVMISREAPPPPARVPLRQPLVRHPAPALSVVSRVREMTARWSLGWRPDRITGPS